MSANVRPSSAVRGELVNIRIEDDPATVYRVHKDLLVEHSEYFKSALNGPWSEAEDGIAPLEGVDHRTFEIFVDWVYTQNLSQEPQDWLLAAEQPTCDI